jgi:putative component of toxin-antitoxin plasmid stabilization module
MKLQLTQHYLDWINGLKDRATRARIRVLTEGVVELKIDVGPGYRVYFTERDATLIVLLAGGDKSTQDLDIELALQLVRTLPDTDHG